MKLRYACIERNTEAIGENVHTAMIISDAEEKGISFSLKRLNKR